MKWLQVRRKSYLQRNNVNNLSNENHEAVKLLLIEVDKFKID